MASITDTCVINIPGGQSGIINNTTSTTVTNYANGGNIVNSTTYAIVNLVPNTYLTANKSTTVTPASWQDLFSFGALQPGRYLTTFSHTVVDTPGVLGDTITFRIYASTSPGISPSAPGVYEYDFVTGTSSSDTNSSAAAFYLPVLSPVTIQGYYVGTGVCVAVINACVTLQKIG